MKKLLLILLSLNTLCCAAGEADQLVQSATVMFGFAGLFFMVMSIGYVIVILWNEGTIVTKCLLCTSVVGLIFALFYFFGIIPLIVLCCLTVLFLYGYCAYVGWDKDFYTGKLKPVPPKVWKNGMYKNTHALFCRCVFAFPLLLIYPICLTFYVLLNVAGYVLLKDFNFKFKFDIFSLVYHDE